MGQEEYNAFLEQMKQWMLDNSYINDKFEEIINSQRDVSVKQIMSQAMAMAPTDVYEFTTGFLKIR